MIYAKLFSSITESSLWCEPNEVRLLFVSMLAKADSSGFVEAALPGLAKLANLTLPEVESAIKSLESPDPHSKNPEHEGRRILKVPGGWMLLNYEEYHSRKGNEERRQYMRDYMQNYRAGKAVNGGKHRVNKKFTSKQAVNECKHSPSPSLSPSLFTRKEVELPFKSDRFAEAWSAWVKFRSDIKKPLTDSTIQMQLKKLEAMGEDRAVAMIEHTIFKGWQGLREEEPDSFGRSPRKGSDPRGNLAAAQNALENLNVE